MPTSRKIPKIGIFDSGFGGLTVMKAVCHHLPQANIVYLGDTARLPYGNKSKDTIVRYSLENANFLLSQNIDILVIACHTASSYAKDILSEKLSIPVVDMISPSIQLAVSSSKTKKIAVLGTQGTISSHVYQREFQKKYPEIELFPIPCPLFVHLVEEGFIDHPATEIIAKEYLFPLIDQDIDVTILACTHYPLLHTMIQNILGEKMILIDPALPSAEEIRSLLKKDFSLSSIAPSYEFFVSDNPQKFQQMGSLFLGRSIDYVSLQNIDPIHKDMGHITAFSLS